MADPILQPSMSGGELAPSLFARVDIARYQVSLKTCRNFVSQVYGGVKNRTGSKLVAETKDSGKVRLIPFVFSTSQAYVLELGNRSLRAHVNGAPLDGVTSKPNYGTINPVDIGGGFFTLTASMPTFKPSDVSDIRIMQVWISAGDLYQITGYTSPTEVTASSAANLTGLTYSPSSEWMFVANGPGVVFETDTPWTADELADLVFTQSADVITACHPDHPPQDIRRLGDGTFQVVPTSLINGPFTPVNADKTLTIMASATTGTITLAASKPIFTTAMIGSLLYLEQTQAGTLWAPGATVSDGDVRLSDGKYYRAIGSGTAGTVAPTHYDGTESDGLIDWLYLHSGFGVARITAVGLLVNGFAITATAVVDSVLPDGLVGVVVNATVSAYAVSPANPAWVRATATAHGFSDYQNATYTAS